MPTRLCIERNSKAAVRSTFTNPPGLNRPTSFRSTHVSESRPETPSDSSPTSPSVFYQDAEKVRQHKKTDIWFVSFVWLNKTN
jgi:hypothetical protein